MRGFRRRPHIRCSPCILWLSSSAHGNLNCTMDERGPNPVLRNSAGQARGAPLACHEGALLRGALGVAIVALWTKMLDGSHNPMGTKPT